MDQYLLIVLIFNHNIYNYVLKNLTYYTTYYLTYCKSNKNSCCLLKNGCYIITLNIVQKK